LFKNFDLSKSGKEFFKNLLDALGLDVQGTPRWICLRHLHRC